MKHLLAALATTSALLFGVAFSAPVSASQSSTTATSTLTGFTISLEGGGDTCSNGVCALPPMKLGSAVNYGFIATGGQGGTPDIWSLVSGTLPAGLKLYTPYYGAQTTMIYGTPTVEQATTFTLQAQDPLGDTTQQTYTLTVGAPAPLAVTNPNPCCMPGTLGVAYRVNMFASGGVQPYSWSVASGKVPPGLMLASSGVLSGTPTRTGTFTFTPRVTDSLGTQATGRQVSIQVGR